MQNALAVIHYNSWYVHVSRMDDHALLCFKYDEVTHRSELEYFDSVLDASDWVLEPVRDHNHYEGTVFISP